MASVSKRIDEGLFDLIKEVKKQMSKKTGLPEEEFTDKQASKVFTDAIKKNGFLINKIDIVKKGRRRKKKGIIQFEL